MAAGLLAAQPGGWIGAPSGNGGAAVPDAWPPSGDAAFAGLLPGYAFAQSMTLNLTATDSITDTGALLLDGARNIAIFESGGSTYAAVTTSNNDGVQIFNITDPSDITAAGNIADGGALELNGAWGITTFESGGSTYAAVAAYDDDGVQILDVTDPSAITAAGNITNGGALLLDGARDIAIFESGGSTYAAVAAYDDDGVQILDVTDPSAITAAGNITDTATLELNGAWGITTFESGGSTYAAVASLIDDGVQILDITDPSAITAAGSIADGGALVLNGAQGITTFKSGGSTYAAVASYIDDGIQILNITDPSNVIAADSIADGGALVLDNARGITTFESGGSTYAAVTSYNEDGVQILDVTDPSAITAAGSITDGGALELNGAWGITTFESGGSTYAAVASFIDDGVQILRLTDPPPAANSPPVVGAGDDQEVAEGATVTLSGTASDDDPGDTLTYSWTHDGTLAITITGSDSLSASFTAPDVAANTTITVTLTVSDGTVEVSDALQVNITDSPSIPPAADAGLNLTATDSITDGGTLELLGAGSIAVFESGGSTYAAVAALLDNGVQILDITDPYNVTAAGSIDDGRAPNLFGPSGITTFESGGSTYAAVAAILYDGVQILNVTDPSDITTAGSIGDTAALELDGAYDITTFESGGSTYVAVAAYIDDGVQILDITDPSAITAAGNIGDTDALLLDGANGITVFESGGITYAAVAAYIDDGVQILDITDPSNVTAAGSIGDDGTLELDGAEGITTFESGGSTYAAVAARDDDGVQILDVTDPSAITAAGSIGDDGALELDGALNIATFESGGSTYAAVAAYDDDGVQILDITDPSNVTAADSIGDDGTLELDGAYDITTFESGGSTYAAVASSDDNGVQILRLTGGAPPVTPNSPPVVGAGDDQEVVEGATVTLSGTASDVDPEDTLTYSWTHDGALTIAITGSDSPSASFTAPNVAANTTITVTLTVSDGTVEVSDALQVTIADSPSIPPAADAGLNLTAAGSITDDGTNTDELELNGARNIAMFESGGSTYAAVASSQDDGVQILDVTDPSAITAAGNITDTAALELDGAYGITTFESGGSTYAAVTADSDSGVQILDVTDPSDITAAGNIGYTATLVLGGAAGITTFESGGSTYAAVTAYFGDGVQILDITDPFDITAAGNITDTAALELDGAEGIVVFESGGSTYAAVAARDDDGVQILNITDPFDITAAGNITDTDALGLDGASDIATFAAGGSTYAAVAARDDDGVQILDITDPSAITAAGSITDDTALKLAGASGIAVFESGGSTYAAVAAESDDGVQILNITDPFDITAAGNITDTDALELDGAYDIATFESGGSTYAAVASVVDDGVQILRLTGDGVPPVTVNSPPEVEAGADQEVAEGATVTLSGTASDVDPGDTLTYSWTHDGTLAIAITGSDSLSASFTAPNVAADTTITVTLTVSDGTVGVSDTLQVTIADSPSIPVVVPPPEGAFVTTWKTTSANEAIAIPVGGTTGNYTVHWGDGNVTTHDDDATHTYASAGNHTVSISGDFTRIYLNNDQDIAPKLVSIDQWGDMEWATMEGAFRGASAMIYNATDVPDLSGVTSMIDMFNGASSFNGNLSGWDVSGVTRMDQMFIDAVAFDGDISGWDVSSVSIMASMFVDASAFNGDISGWDVSSVDIMGNMFTGATAFNADISAWNVSSVTDMSYMFVDATAFNADISAWDVSDVNAMFGMFDGATSFNADISGWDVSHVTAMFGMFDGATSFNADISGWDVSHVTAMFGMFDGATSFNADISGWNVSSVTNMAGMFAGATSFRQNLGDWYIVLDDASIDLADAGTTIGTISPQNSWLAGQTGTYGIAETHDHEFEIVDGTKLSVKADADYTAKTGYVVNITSTYPYGTNNHRLVDVTVTDSSAAFVTTWETTSAGETITIPATGTYGIDWGDGTVNATVTGEQTHTYANPGNHTVSISGDFTRIYLGDSNVADYSANAEKLVSIDQWGDMEWATMDGAFRGASNMVYNATDAPDLSGVTDMSHMFTKATFFNGNLSGWDVSSVTDMSYMFWEARALNGNISSWNVSSVTDMGNMFHGAEAFNGNISSWNVSSVTDMGSMFLLSAFKGDISAWNVSSVTNMDSMFSHTPFNRPLNSWDVSSVISMSSMFKNALSFNGNLSGWDVSGVTNMDEMFYNAKAFNSNLSAWNVSSVTNMQHMLLGATSFNSNLSAWNVSSVTNMQSMFSGATSFNSNLSAWNVSSVTNMQSMFSGASSFNGDISAWDVSRVTDMRTVFSGASSFNGDISAWDVSRVTDMRTMFSGASSFNGNISSWNVSSVTDMVSMFYEATSFDGDLPEWDVSSVTNMANMFHGATSFNGNISGWDVSSVTIMASMFAGATDFNADISGWNVSSVTNMASMFAGATSFRQNLGDWYIVLDDASIDLADAGTTIGTISPQNDWLADQGGAYGIAETHDYDFFDLDSTSLNVKPDKNYAAKTDYTVNITSTHPFGANNHRLVDVTVTDSSAAFVTTWETTSAGETITIPATGTYAIDWGDGTVNATATGTQAHAYGTAGTYEVSISGGLASISLEGDSVNAAKLKSIDRWGDIRWTTMENAFYEASGMTYNATDVPDLSGVTSMAGMFEDASAFNGDLSGWDVSGVTDMQSMFSGASSFNGNITGWDVSSVTDMSFMFFFAGAFDQDISGWDVSRVTTMTSMFFSFPPFSHNLGKWYITLDSTSINLASDTAIGTISPQNAWLAGQDGAYGIGESPDSDLFEINGTSLNVKEGGNYTAKTDYVVNITSTYPFGTNNHRVYDVTVTDSSAAFVTTWQTTAANETITIPATGSYAIDWGDGTVNATATGTQAHAYGTAGTYEVSISGGLASISLAGDSANAAKLKSIDLWGGIRWTTMEGAFQGASGMTYNATDVPDLSGVTSMAGMFEDASAFNGDLSGWDVSGVTDMQSMFSGASSFNGNITGWDVSSVTDMSFMFFFAGAFDQDISGWDVSRVTTMTSMFFSFPPFSHNLGKWYITLDSTSINLASDTAIGTISPQNAWLAGQDGAYGIGESPDSDLFEINGTSLNVKEGGNYTAKTDYVVNITSTYPFGTNNHRVYDVTVTDSSAAFVTTWQTTAANETITIPATGSYAIDWGDGTVNATATGTQAHAYGTAGTYEVSISGGLASISLAGDSANAAKLKSIDLWGGIRWTTMEGAFQGASGMTYNATDVPDLSVVTSMASMFEDATDFNGDLSGWDVSGVTDMNGMFEDAAAFDGDISSWNVSSVTNMDSMFSGASAFNADISGWNVSSVTDMDDMFTGATSFEQNLGKWHVTLDSTSVDLADSTTVGTISPQSAWFAGQTGAYGIAETHDHEFFEIVDGTKLSVKAGQDHTTEKGYVVNITSTYPWGAGNHLLADVTVTNSSYIPRPFITTWELTLITDLYITLGGTYTVDWGDGTVETSQSGINSHRYNNPGNYSIAISGGPGSITFDRSSPLAKEILKEFVSIDQWGDIRWTSMDGMFWDASNMTYDATDAPDLSSGPSMANMFRDASSFDGNLSGWDVSSVRDMNSMFHSASSFDGNLSGWDVSSVRDMNSMFHSASSFDGNLSGWDVSSVRDMNSMFHSASSFDGNLSGWDVSSVRDMNSMFHSASSFDGNLSGWDVSSVTEMGGMFRDASSFNGNLSGWNPSSVESMKNMFLSASVFNGDISSWNTSSVTDMNAMFSDAARFNADLSGWDTSSVESMKSMFFNAEQFNADLSGWDTSSVTNMGSMFGLAYSFNADISGWNVSSVTDMGQMFVGITPFPQNLGNWFVVPADTHYDNAEASLNVTTIAAQNPYLDGRTFTYGIGDGHDFDSFNMTGSTLMFKSAPSAPAYKVNVTAVGSIFGTNNHRILDITVDGVDPNTNPVLGDIAPRSVNELVRLEFNATATDTDTTDTLVFSLVDPYPDGASIGGNTGTFAWTPGEAQDGNHTVTVRVSDGRGGEHSRDVQIEVREVNLPPELAVATAHEATELEPLEFNATATDPDTVGAEQTPNDLTFSLDGEPDGAAINSTTGAFSWTPAANQNGTHTMDVRVSDGIDTDSEAVTVTVADSGPGSLPQGAFVTTWKADTSPDTVSIPVRVHSGGTVTIHWGDGSSSTVSSNGAQTHTYQDSGRYQVAMTGDLSRIITGGSGSTPGQLLSIDQWGDGTWGSMQDAFKGAVNMEYKATDTPDLSGVASTLDMFRGTSFTGNLSGWNVSNVDTMKGMFYDANHFDGNLSGWNVSAVTDMHSMFRGAHNFNQPLSSWDTSGVTDMRLMFHGARSFNGNISSWDTSGVVTMREMFHGAISFNGTISGWDVSSVTNMRDMFNGAEDFNQDISGWNVSNVANMADMFNGATAFRQNLGDWYIVLNSTSINAADAPGIVGTISAQNPVLDGQNPTYAIGTGGDSGSFNITGGSNLNMNISSPAKSLYKVSITSTGSFGTSNHRVYNVTVTDPDTNSPPVVGAGDDQEVVEGATVTLSGTASDVDLEDTLTYLWTHDSSLAITFADPAAPSTTFTAPGVATDTTITVTLTVNDGTVDVFDTLRVTITDSSSIPPAADARLNLTATDSIIDTTALVLSSARGITTFESGNSTYAAVAAALDGVQIIDITDPSNVTAAGDNDRVITLELFGASDITTFESDNSTYAAVAAFDDDGVQILDITDPSDITAAGNIADAGTLLLDGARAITAFESGGSTYAAVAAYNDNGVQILDITDPSAITAAGSITDTAALELDGASGITTFESGGSTYAAVTGYLDDGVQILDITVPSAITAAGSITDTAALRLDGARGIAVFESGGSTYAAVAAESDDGVQILDITDPSAITAAGSITDTAARELDGARGITIFESGGSTYAAVAAYNDNGVQILNITDPSAITAAGSITDTAALALNGAEGITTFESGGSTYAAVASVTDDGVQILRLTGDGVPPVTVNSPPVVGAGDDQEVVEGSTVNLDGTADDLDTEDALTYSWSHNSTLTISLADSAALDTSFTAPNVSEDTPVEFTLRVSDGTASVSDGVIITIQDSANTPPTVNAGPDQEVVEGSTVNLDGTADDLDTEDALTYSWSHNSTLTISLADSAALDTSFTAPNVSEDTPVEFTLRVSDGTASVSDGVIITIQDSANTPPTVNAGPDQEVVEGSTVNLDGTADDLDTEDALTYSWSHNSTLTISLADSAALDTSFTAPNVSEDTPVEFTLRVSDGTASVSDGVIITIQDSANTPPTVNAGPDQEVVEGSTVNLDGTADDLDTEDALTYSWSHNSTLTISLADSAALDTSFTAPNVSEDTPVEFTLRVSDGTASVSDGVIITIQDSANTPPTVNAGPDQEVVEGSTVNLDGTADDLDTEDALTYSWSHNSTLTISLADSAALDTSFTAPNVSEDTPVEFTLRVSDGTASVSDGVIITIQDSANTPPTVNAGPDQEVVEGSTVNLDGTADDLDTEDALTYSWSHNSTLTISLADSAALDTSFTAPNVSEDTPVEFTLRVSDGTASVSDGVIITIQDSANTPPTVNAGPDQEVVEGSTVNLDGTADDLDTEDALTYSWSHNSTLTISLADSAALDTSFTAPNVSEDTPVEFTLRVSDGTASVSDGVIITIQDSANTPPTVNAGPDQEVVEGSTVNLDGTADDLDTEDALTYSWSHNSTLTISLADSAALDTSFTAPNVSEDTPVEFTLRVSDGTASVSDGVIITIQDSANTPPTVNAGPDQEVVEGSTVNLDGTADDLDTEDALTYSWSHNSTLTISLADSAALDTSFTAPNVSEDTPVEFTLRVSDGTASVSDGVIITIQDSANTPPTVNAGPDQEVVEGSTVNLDGTADDLDTEDALTYSWSHNSTLTISLADSAALDTSFTAPNVSEDTPVEFTLRVSDGTASVSDGVIITIQDSANTPPTVNAGPDQEVVEGSTVNLDGTADDLDTEDALTYSWSHNSTLTISLADSAALDTSFTAPNVSEDTPVEFTLRVSDGTASVSDGVIITIQDSANTPPTVNAGPDQEVVEGSTVNLDGTADDLDTEDALTYSWSHNSTLTISLADSAALDTSFTAPNVSEDTPVEFTLRVSDGTASVSDEVIITIQDSANTPPTVNAGPDQEVVEGAT